MLRQRSDRKTARHRPSRRKPTDQRAPSSTPARLHCNRSAAVLATPCAVQLRHISEGPALLTVAMDIFRLSVPLPLADKLHALFHLTSTAGPQMLLTGLALSKHHGERIAAVPHWRFGGLPAVVRGDKAV